MPHGSHAVTATVYAKDARRLAAFYTAVLGLIREGEGATSIVRLGGGLAAPGAVWSWRGHVHLDGWDPEGNVFQLRQAELGADDTMSA